ncbi:MAG: hypothetical protein EAX96_10735 [Candidatus Lokiarchaeota archaeon]|nr:hypothetical protein [Candidatus Lokiarchaeota archaeon]
MSLGLLYLDEFKGYYQSKVIIILWIGLPIITLLLHFIPSNEEIPISSLAALVVASVGGTISSVMISTTIVSEMNQNVYVLFLVRPVKRANLLIAKFLAVYTCLTIATVLSVTSGLIVDIFTKGMPQQVLLEDTFESITISLAAMAIATSAGLLIGSNSKSIAVAAILSIYLGNQLSIISILPGIFLSTWINPILFSILIGLPTTIALLIVSMMLFNKKQF